MLLNHYHHRLCHHLLCGIILVELSIWFLYKCGYPVKKVSVRALHTIPNTHTHTTKKKKREEWDFRLRTKKKAS